VGRRQPVMHTMAVDPVLSLVGRGALSLLFGWAAVHKLRDVQGFRAALAGYELMPPVWTVPMGALVIGAELGIAAGLWLPRVAGAAALAGAVLLALYGGAMAVNLRRGRRDIDCGCGGPAGRQPISAWLVGRNAGLASVAVFSALPVAARPLVWVDFITVAAAVATTALLYAAADQLRVHHRGSQRDTEVFSS